MFNQTHKILLALGVGAVSLMGASQVSAQQAYISGSSTLVLMNGASQSIGAEVSVPNGLQIPGPVTVTPAYQGAGAQDNLSVNTTTFANTNGLTVAAGAAAAAPTDSSFTAAAAARLDAATSLSEVVSIIRAGAGVDGLD